jgi:hypothetical protein
MLLDNLFSDETHVLSLEERQKLLYNQFGILSNPFPSAAPQTSEHPHKSTEADKSVDDAVKTFYFERKSHVLAVTASQGIGKTNLLNAYEKALREKLYPRGFFLIRYVADPEPSFEPLMRSVFEWLGKDYLYRSIEALAARQDQAEELLGFARTGEVKAMLKAFLQAEKTSKEKLNLRVSLAYEWLLGFPVRKAHKEELDIYFRLDTVESKTRVLRDIVYLGYEMKTLEGLFILLDELEKPGISFSKTSILRYLAALRALIDALPKYLFLMVALTTDALNRYREMNPAIKGRLAHEVTLLPLRSATEGIELCHFYLEHAQQKAHSFAQSKKWRAGNTALVEEGEMKKIFNQLSECSTIEGIRQRDYLQALSEKANEVFTDAIPS